MKNSILLIIIFLLFSCSNNERLKIENRQEIQFDYEFYFLENGFIQFEIDYFIPFNKLIFTKEEDGFISDITLSFDVIEQNKSILYNNSWSQNIAVDFFEDTKSKKDYIGNFSFVVDNRGEYLMELFVNDYKNHKFYKKQKQISINPYDYLTDLEFYIKDNDKYFNIDYLENFELENLDTLWIKYQLIDNDVQDNSIVFELKNRNIEDNNVFRYVIDSSDLNSYTISFYPIPMSDVEFDNLLVNCYYRDIHKTKSINIDKEQKVEIDYNILFYSMENYILNSKEYIEYIDLKIDDKIEYIKKYWLQKNNEDLFIEFYQRVRYSNLNFKKLGKKGSESDQGRIYILYGKPLHTDFEYNENGEFEIWEYRNKKFIFINRFGYYECYRC